MLQRVVGLCAVGLGLGAMLLQAQYLFVLPGAGSASGTVAAFSSSPLSEINSFTAGNGSFLALPNQDATQFYIVAGSTYQTLTTTYTSFSSPTILASLTSPATNAVMTPDGRLLAVAAGALHLFDTTSNTEIIPGGLSQGTGVTTVDVASSLDSATVFALGTSNSGGSVLTAFSTASRSITASLSISSAATALAVGPNGLIYVSAPSQILEVDPRTLQPTVGGNMSVSGTPQRLIFTPDGQYALAANQSVLVNSAVFVITLATHSVTAPSLGLSQVLGLTITGLDTAVAVTSQGLYEITVTNPVSVAPFPVSGLGNILAITTTNDVPASAVQSVQYLFALSGTELYEISLATQSLVAEYPINASISGGALSYTAATITTAQSSPAIMLSYGSNQTIPPSGTSEPLVVRVLDSNNRPILGVPVQFTTNSPGTALSTYSTTTGASGFSLTYLTAPVTAAPITVTATAGALTTNFTVNVSTSAAGNGPQMTIIAGQGQLMLPGTSTQAGSVYGSPLEVLVSDSSGNPLAGVPVTFTVSSTAGSVGSSSGSGAIAIANTDLNGIAQVNYLASGTAINNSSGYLQNTVTATSPNTNAVNFYITTVTNNPSPSVYVESPNPGVTITGPEGTTIPAAVSIQVVSSTGQPIPNVSLLINDGNLDPTLYPTASCAPSPTGAALTNFNGVASCDVVLGPRIGAGTFTATVGYTHSSGAISFQATAGAPGIVQIIQGNNQSGGPGQTLPLALLIHVTDSGGNTLVNTPVTWTVVTPGTVTLSQVVGATDTNGNASALATLGNVAGVAQVTATAGSVTVGFDLTVVVPTAGLQKISGDQQSATINTAFTSPLVVKVVDSKGNGIAGAQVNFQVTSGSASLGFQQAYTDSTGQADTTVTAGATPGAITITATTSTFSVSFTLTAQGPGPTNLAVVNGASFDPTTGISPGSVAVITGMDILPGVQGLVTATPNSAGQLPTSFSGVTVTFNGTPAPIYYVQDTNGSDQVSVQVPVEVQPGASVAVQVSVTNLGSTTITVPVTPVAPAVYTATYSGKSYAVALRPDGSSVSPTNPAQPGENIRIFATGLGQTSPAIATGTPGAANQTVTAPLLAGLNNAGVPLISAVYAQGTTGLYVVTIQVPTDAPTGSYQPVGIVAYDPAGNAYFAPATYIPIQ